MQHWYDIADSSSSATKPPYRMKEAGGKDLKKEEFLDLNEGDQFRAVHPNLNEDSWKELHGKEDPKHTETVY